ncbi:hypothetical protein ACFLZX_02800 [Nanoarchaeota archaeon]
MVKKGIFFSLDALIATFLILTVVILMSMFYTSTDVTTQPVYFSSDLVNVLSTLELREIDDPYIVNLLVSNNVTDFNRSVLEQIFRFQVEGKSGIASDLANRTIGGYVPDYYSMGIWNEDDNIYLEGNLSSRQLISSKQLITGLEKDKVIEGYSSRAYLSNINENSDSVFTYFGGYEGDGIITKKVILPDDISSINGIYLELSAPSDFDLYINGQYAGNYSPNPVPRASEFFVDSSFFSLVNEGENDFRFVFNGTYKYVGGGYIKVDYTSSEILDNYGSQRYYFPGIAGLINVYSSFWVPGSINTMNLYLHYDSNYSLFLTIGNTTVFNETLEGDNIVTLSDTQLSSLLDYIDLSNSNVPLRLGTSEFSSEIQGGNADVILITDISASMDYEMDTEDSGIERDCDDPLLFDSSTKRISVAKCLDKEFIGSILNNSGNRVGLSAFYGDEKQPFKGRVYEEGLTNDIGYLSNAVDAYTVAGGTCICCAINDAYKILEEQSDDSRLKFVVVMSDGIPTHTCQAASGCTGERTGLPNKEGLWLGWGAGCYGDIDDCEVNDCMCARTNANWSSCRLREDMGATVYSIGFGPVSSCSMANDTLQDIATCGGGEYYSSDNASVLSTYYQNISEEIRSYTYERQVAVVSDGIGESILYPESYIEILYDPISPPYEYGSIPITIVTDRFGNEVSQGEFEIPLGSVVYDAKVTSFSGDAWTDRGIINGDTFFNLSDFGENYQRLGDPYMLVIPTDQVQEGINIVEVGTGISVSNSTLASPDNRVIYKIGVDLEVNYTSVFNEASGCNWQLGFEDGTNSTLTLPFDYLGSSECVFNSGTNCDVDYNGDAVNNAICTLFDQLDFDGDGLLFVKFESSDVTIDTISVGKIPYMWGPSTVEVRVWK